MPSSEENLLGPAGIMNSPKSYPAPFTSDEVLDARYFKALDRFDIRFARALWIYDNVRSGSAVLDLGCGAGILALLKRKGITLTGIDFSEECALAARRNGYDATFSAELSCLPFADGSFDYVVSLDFPGHIENKERDALLAEVKRVLRPGGVTLHSIECPEHSARAGYDEMSEEQRRFVDVSAPGWEEDHEHVARFSGFFQHVACEPRYTLCLSSEDFLKQNDQYGLNYEADFLDYLRGLSFKERRAFDMAMGYVFNKVSDLDVPLPNSGLYVFLKASDAPLGPFYNEHRDRSGLFLSGRSGAIGKGLCLDRSSAATFDDGWYQPGVLPPVARWMSKRGRVHFTATKVAEITFDLTTDLPDLRARPLGLELLLNGVRLCAFSLCRYGWLELRVRVPENLRSGSAGGFELELRADRTSEPRQPGDETDDDRELSVAVCNIQIHQ